MTTPKSTATLKCLQQLLETVTPYIATYGKHTKHAQRYWEISQMLVSNYERQAKNNLIDAVSDLLFVTRESVLFEGRKTLAVSTDVSTRDYYFVQLIALLVTLVTDLTRIDAIQFVILDIEQHFREAFPKEFREIKICLAIRQ